MPLIMSSEGSGILKCFIDGSFAVNPNMLGHNGGGILIRRGFPIVSLTKQKLNTQSFKETEVMVVDDCMPDVLWNSYCLDAHGYDAFENIVFQDNESDVLLEKNCKDSRSKHKKHINI